MANYSAIKAAVNAYIKANGRKEITGMILNAVLNATIDSLGRYFQFAGGALPTDDPGTPDQNVCYLAGEPGVYTNFGGITIENEEVALLFWNGEWTKQSVLIGIREVNASVDNQVGTPSVDVSYSGGELVLTFHNLKGEQGETGDPAGFGTIGADINGGVGTPGVSVETSGDNTAKNLMFHFTNLKGETGVTSVVATIDNTSGTPACQVSLVNGVLTLAFSGLKGLKGDTGVSADYPITIYNGLDSDATDQALAAAQGKRLGDDLSQLEAEVTDLQDFTDNIPVNSVDSDALSFDLAQKLLIDSGTAKLKSSSYSYRKVAYYQTSAKAKLHISLRRTTSSSIARGICGYVNSISEVVAGTAVQEINTATGATSGTTDFYFDLPAGKVFVIDLYNATGGQDTLVIKETKTELVTKPFNNNIIDGAYSWWSGPHCDRKVIERQDYSVFAYIKSSMGLFVALYNNNSHTYTERQLMQADQVDDHNAPACIFLNDGRIIVTTASGHATGPNQKIFVADYPFSLDSFTERTITTTGNCAYSRLIKQGSYLFLFWREAVSGDSYWHLTYSTDEFATNAGDLEFMANSYVYVEKTTDPDYIKIYPCGHPVENTAEKNKIRAGYIKISTMEIFDADATTKIANVGTLVANEDFSVLIDSATGAKNRFLDAAITPVGSDVFVYSKGDNASTPYDGKYHLYKNGVDTIIADTGEPFHPSSKYVGGAVVSDIDNNKVVLSRRAGGKWFIERYDVQASRKEIIDFSEVYLLRPLKNDGCQFAYQKGDYNETSFGGFKTNIIIKDIFI